MADVSAMAKVAMLLLSAFSKDKVTSEDLTAAEEAVRGLTFDVYNEKTSSKVMTGIQLHDYESLINSIAKRLGLPDGLHEAILEGKFAVENEEVVTNFSFSEGKTSTFTFGRIVTVKRDKATIDMAYSVYHLEFKLSPQVIEHTKRTVFLGFTTSKKVWRETRERNLSTFEYESLIVYFMNKTIEGFKKEHAHLLKGLGPQHKVDEL